MQLKLLCGRSGVELSQNAGDVIEVDDAEGERMIAAGQAELCIQERPSQNSLNQNSLAEVARQPGLLEKAAKKIFGEKATANE